MYLIAASTTKIVIFVTTRMILHTIRMLPRDTGSINTSGFLLRYLPRQSEAGLPPGMQKPLTRWKTWPDQRSMYKLTLVSPCVMI